MKTVRKVDSILSQMFLRSYKRFLVVAQANNNFWTSDFSCHMDPYTG